MTDVPESDGAIEAAVLDLVARRGADKTVCPSEVARHVAGPHPDAWRRLMPSVRRVAVRLAKAGRIAILRGGTPVEDVEGLEGVYRLGLPRDPS